MSKPTQHDPFPSISTRDLDKVAGGASRVTLHSSSSNDQLTQMLTQITDSIKALSQNNSQSDPSQMLMMMMMMGGLGGGGGGGGGGVPMAAPQPMPQAAPTPAPIINISTTVKRHGF
jgi:hypothetical protein